MNVDSKDYKWLDKINISSVWVNRTVLALMNLHHRLFILSVKTHDVMPVSSWVLSPLLERFGGDESSPQVAVPHTLGLPPRGVVLGHDLQDVSPLEGKSRFLARRRLVFQRDVVKQGSHVHLESESTIFRCLLL